MRTRNSRRADQRRSLLVVVSFGRVENFWFSHTLFRSRSRSRNNFVVISTQSDLERFKSQSAEIVSSFPFESEFIEKWKKKFFFYIFCNNHKKLFPKSQNYCAFMCIIIKPSVGIAFKHGIVAQTYSRHKSIANGKLIAQLQNDKSWEFQW